MRSDFFVVSTPVTDGERFAILRRETMATRPFLWSLLPEDWRRAFDSYVKGAGLLMEDQVRAQLAEMGLSSDAVDDQIRRARNLQALNAQTSWERTTRIGYCNTHGQEVIRKTRLAGTLHNQRVYVLRCNGCGHEYGADGCDIHLRRCPICEGGVPGQPASKID